MNLTTNNVGETIALPCASAARAKKLAKARKLRETIAKLEKSYREQIGQLNKLAFSLEQQAMQGEDQSRQERNIAALRVTMSGKL